MRSSQSRVLLRRVTSALAAVVVFTACGGGSLRLPTLPGSSCRVLTPSEARQFLGSAAKRHQDPVTGACTYTVNKRSAIALLQVQTFAGTKAYRPQLYAHIRKLAHVGDKAYVHVDPARHAAQLRFVRRGRTYALSYSVLDRRHPASAAGLAMKLVVLARRIANG